MANRKSRRRSATPTRGSELSTQKQSSRPPRTAYPKRATVTPRLPPVAPQPLRRVTEPPVREDRRLFRQSAPKQLDGRPARVIRDHVRKSKPIRPHGPKIFRSKLQRRRVEYYSALDAWHRSGRVGSRPVSASERVQDSGGEDWRFHRPRSVWTCLKRQVRREIIHALKLTAKGARGKKHRGPYSEVHC